MTSRVSSRTKHYSASHELYRGNQVECPVCGRSFSKFLSYGSEVAHRENVLCPYDLTLERHRLLWLYLNRETNFFSAQHLKVLHIAPEQCFLPLFKKQKNLSLKMQLTNLFLFILQYLSKFIFST